MTLRIALLAGTLALPILAAGPALSQGGGMTTGIDAVGATAETAADHIAITELTNLFENAFDEGDIDTHMATWADTLSFTSPFGNYDSRESYREWVQNFSNQMSGMGGTRHLITNSVIVVDGDTARQTAYLVILARTANEGGPAPMATVRFEDELTRTADGWRFTSRTLNLDQDPAMFSGK